MSAVTSSPITGLKRHLPAQYFWPLFLLLGACFGCVLLLLLTTTRSQDLLQAERERRAVEDALDDAAAMVQRDLEDYAKWDDAVRNVVWGYRPEWVTDNITAYLGVSQGYDHIFAIDPRDRTIYGFSHGKIDRRNAESTLGRDFAAMLANMRRIPPARAPKSSGFTRSDDGIFVYAAAAIVPLTAKARLKPGPAHILVIARKVDSDFLMGMKRDVRLRTLDLSSDPVGGSLQSVAITSTGGRPLGYLSWISSKPGTSVRRAVLPTFLCIVAVGLIAAGLILQRGRRSMEALRLSEMRASYHANHDTLTGLPNRRALMARVEEAIAAGERVALLYMDLDGFKDANDVYGHAAGDELLRNAARRIASAAPDAMVARAGGDEFAIFCVNPKPDQVETVAERILVSFKRPFAIGAYRLKVGVSIGSVEHDQAVSDGPDELLRRADVAMYAAKADGKNCCRAYRPDLDRGHDLRLRMEADLRAAIDRNEITVVFQPIVDSATADVVCLEALARWSHPVHGDVPPDVFIPLAEMSGLINALGRTVLTRACLDARALDVSVAVNLSPAQFWDRKLAEDVRTVLARTGFPPERLELEITESYLLRRPDAAASVIDELRRLGIRVALDDFGTGFASIGYLRQLHFDRLKIDREFIEPLGGSSDAAELVSAICALARALGLEITAEGVETQAQADIARIAGCSRLQGWLYGQPVEAGELERLCALGSDETAAEPPKASV